MFPIKILKCFKILTHQHLINFSNLISIKSSGAQACTHTHTYTQMHPHKTEIQTHIQSNYWYSPRNSPNCMECACSYKSELSVCSQFKRCWTDRLFIPRPEGIISGEKCGAGAWGSHMSRSLFTLQNKIVERMEDIPCCVYTLKSGSKDLPRAPKLFLLYLLS